MKLLITLLFSICCISNSFAKTAEDIKISSNGKTNKVELRCTSKSKKIVPVKITVTDSYGKIVSNASADLTHGDNAICLCEALNLEEGLYTAKMIMHNKSFTAKFIIWK